MSFFIVGLIRGDLQALRVGTEEGSVEYETSEEFQL